MRRICLLVSLLAVLGCETSESDPGPGSDVGVEDMTDMATDSDTNNVNNDLGSVRLEALDAVVTVNVRGGTLRTYEFRTTATLRDGVSQTRTVTELADDPRLRSGDLLWDAVFAMAVEEARQNSVETITDGAFNNGQGVSCSCYETGEKWNYVWTRDIGYAVDLGLIWLDPSRARRSLEFKLSERKGGGGVEIIQDTGTGGSWPVSSDRVVWAIGARALIPHLSGQERTDFEELAFEALKNTLETDRIAVFDPVSGLYRGETSFLDWREQTYPSWTSNNFNYIAGSKSLSTNIAHMVAMELAAELAAEHGTQADVDRYGAWASDLRGTIETSFYSEADQMPVSYIGDEFDPTRVRRFDALAIAQAHLNGVSFPNGIMNYPPGELGPAVVHPQLPGVPIYHNRGSWPFVTAYLGLAARGEDVKHSNRFFQSMLTAAALNLSHMENYEHSALVPSYDDGALSGPVVNSRRQLWSVAGFVGAVVQGIVGVRSTEAGLAVDPKFDPTIFANAENGRASEVRLENLLTPNGRVNLVLSLGDSTGVINGGSTVPWAEVVDGASLEIEVNSGVENTNWEFSDDSTAASEVGVSVNANAVSVTAAADIYRDGERVASADGTWTDAAPQSGVSHCYSAAPVGASHSQAGCNWGPSIERRVAEFPADTFVADGGTWGQSGGRGHWVDWGDPDHTLTSPIVVARHTGEHWFQWTYSNGAGPLNTGISAAVKMMRLIDANTGQTVAERVMSFPHTPSWSDWQDSQVLTADLTAGQPVYVQLTDFQNMSYFEHFRPYTGGAGGGDSTFNRVNLAALKVLVKSGVHDASIGERVSFDGTTDIDAFDVQQVLTPGVPTGSSDLFAFDWDADYFYIAIRSDSLASDYKAAFIYLEGAEALTAATPSNGSEYSNQTPSLPFTPTHQISLRQLDDDGSQSGAWNGVWENEMDVFQRVARSYEEKYNSASRTISVKIPRAYVPGRYLRLAAHIVHAEPGNEWKATVPASHTPWAAGGGYYEIDTAGGHSVANWVER